MREAFVVRHGLSPEEWLERDVLNGRPDTLDNFTRADARLIIRMKGPARGVGRKNA